ncbi:MAG: sugar phosphate isomerase/epimerase family protein [Pirellula sp.]
MNAHRNNLLSLKRSGHTRRGFLAGLVGSAGLGAVALSPMAQLMAQEAKAAGLKLGIQIYSLRGFPVEVALDHTKNLGFEEVEFFSGMFPLSASDEEIKKMVDKVKDLGLRISAHGVNGFTKDADANRKVFEFAKKAGIKNISAAPTPDSMDSLNDLVKEYDIRIAIHNHGPSDRFNKVVDVLRAIEGRDPRIGACADLGHFIRSGEKPVEVIRALAGRLYGIHLKDFAEMKENTRGVILGQGHLDCASVFDALIQAKFPADGAMSLEYEENPKDPIEDIRQCVATAKAALSKAKG